MKLLCSNRLEVEELDSSNSNNSSSREQEMEMGTKWEVEIIIVEDKILEKDGGIESDYFKEWMDERKKDIKIIEIKRLDNNLW